jgi:hypothetical protein
MTLGAGTFDSVSGALAQLEPLLAKITQASSLEELVASIYEILKRDFAFKSTGFYFMNPDSGKLELLLADGLTKEEIAHAESTAMERHPGWVIRNQKTYLANLETSEDCTSYQDFTVRSSSAESALEPSGSHPARRTHSRRTISPSSSSSAGSPPSPTRTSFTPSK